MKIKALGTYPLAQKTSYLLTFEDSQIILDAGGTDSNWTLKLPIQDIILPLYIIISHCHTDHSASLPFLYDKLNPIEVYASTVTKQMIGERGVSKQLKTLSNVIVPVIYNQKQIISDELSFILTPAAHAPGASSITILKFNNPIFTFTGDFEVPRRFCLKNQIPQHSPILMVDSTFCAHIRSGNAFRQFLASFTAFLGLPALHPQSAEGVAQETIARLNIYRRKINTNITIQADSVHSFPVNKILRDSSESQNFGDILSQVDQLQSFRQQAIVSVPTSIQSGSSAAQFAILCGMPSIMMIYDLCCNGDTFKLGCGLVKAYQIGTKTIASQMKHFQMWCDQHLDYKDILFLVDSIQPKVLYFQHCLRMNEVNDSAWLVGVMLPFLTVKIFNQDQYTLNTTSSQQEQLVLRVKFALSQANILQAFEDAGIILEQLQNNIFTCGQIILYQQQNYNIISYTANMQIDHIIKQLNEQNL